MSTNVPFIGNATADPEVRFLPSGVAVANFTIAVSQRQFDKAQQQWIDGESMFLRVSAFRDLAEHIAETVTKGQRLIVVGKLKSRTYEKDGEKRTVFEVEADEVGPSLRFATAKVAKASREGSSSTSGGGQAKASDDPWNTPAQSTGSFGGGSDAAPF